MSKKTLENCSFIRKCVKKGIEKPDQRNGKCAGYQKSDTDDEPCDSCIDCKLQENYADNHEFDGITDYEYECFRTVY
jgi:hypothetical protein